MKNYLALLSAVTVALFSSLQAQSPELSGFVLVNAVVSEQPIMARFNGQKVLKEPGLAQGRATSGLGVPTGAGTLTVDHPELGSADIPLDIAVGTTPIVVAYVEVEAAGANAPPQRTLSLKALPSREDKTKSLFQVYYAAGPKEAPLRCMVNSAAVALEPWKGQRVDGSSLDLKIGDEEVGAVVQEEQGLWYAFVAAAPEGKYLSICVPQIVYRW
jgi:hypothetical protein